jgi:hypothetical protein
LPAVGRFVDLTYKLLTMFIIYGKIVGLCVKEKNGKIVSI